MASAQTASPELWALLLSLRGQLAESGLKPAEVDETMATVREISDDPAAGTRLRQVLARPAGLVQAIQRATPQTPSEWQVVGLMALAAFTGPLLAYATLEVSSQTAPALGDPYQAYSSHLPGWAGLAAGIIGLALLIWFLALVSRCRRPTLLGFFGGLVGGIVEVALAVLPWVGIVGDQTTCSAGSGCTVQAGVPAQIGIFAAVCFAIPFIIALTGVAGTLSLWLQRRRLVSAIRSA